jgi:hypothetical protein
LPLWSTGVADAAVVGSWCSDGAPAPCVLSASVDTGGGPATPVASGDPNWNVQTSLTTASGSHDVLWNVTNQHGPDSYELGVASTDDVWVLTLDLGPIVPRVVSMTGDNMTVTRQPQGGGDFHVTITATPVRVTSGATNGTNDDCDQSSWPWTCKGTAVTQRHGYLGGQVTDYNSWTDTAQRDSFYGMDFSTNIEATEIPPQITGDPSAGTAQLLINLANPHFWPDGSTVFHGFAHMRIPNRFLRVVYGIDDPASMTGSGLTATVTKPDGTISATGTTTVSQDAAADAMLVDATGITFSAKRLHIRRGVITPTRPTKLVAHRGTQTRGRIGFAKSRSRGSKVTGYYARCISLDKKSVRTGSALASPIVIRHLVPGKRYDCQVRAKSRAGHSRWSTKARMPSHA